MTREVAGAAATVTSYGCGAPVDPFGLDFAGPSCWAAFVGSTAVSITGPSSIGGHVDFLGIDGKGSFSMSDGTVGGDVVVSTQSHVSVSGPAKIAGGIKYGNQRNVAAGQTWQAYMDYAASEAVAAAGSAAQARRDPARAEQRRPEQHEVHGQPGRPGRTSSTSRTSC